MLKQNYMIWLLLALTVTVSSCKKYKDTPGPTDPRLSRPYCNDPVAVNYNWDFPGTPDNTTCIYPAEIFAGDYDYTDSVYNSSSIFLKEIKMPLTITALDHIKMTISGFCPSGALAFTASRRLRTDADSTGPAGQMLCRTQDTVSGNITRNDIISAPLVFELTVISDTGTFFHRGSAIKR